MRSVAGLAVSLFDSRYIGFKFGDLTSGTSGGVVTWTLEGAARDFSQVSETGHVDSLYAGRLDVGDVLAAAFDAWEAVANITFSQVSATNADIHLNAGLVSGGSYGEGGDEGSSIVVSFRSPDNAGVVFDSGELWAQESKLLYVAIHEIGHAIGLEHTSGADNVMVSSAVIPSTFNFTAEDISQITNLYGTAQTSGADYLFGADISSFRDSLSGGDGSDYIAGFDGDDILYGNRNTDQLHGDNGNDTLFGGQNNGPSSTGNGSASDGTWKWRSGTESVFGGAGNDVLYGNYGTDLLSGGTGNDVLYGGQDIDTLSGGSGNDLLIGNRGDDILVGGSGNDVFEFYGEWGDDQILDFLPGTDLLKLSGSISLANTSGGVQISSGDQTIVVSGYDEEDVSASWFYYGNSVSDGSPFAYYSFDGSVTDSSGSNSGQTYSSISYGSGVSGSSVQFNSSSSYVDFGSGSDFDKVDDDFTMAFWIKSTSGGIVFDMDTPGSSSTDWYGGLASDGTVYFSFSNAGKYGETSVSDGNWHHVAFARDASDNGKFEIYVDGALDASYSGITSSLQANENFLLGSWDNSSGTKSGGFSGSLDELAFYDGHIGASAIQTLYSSPGSYSILDIA